MDGNGHITSLSTHGRRQWTAGCSPLLIYLEFSHSHPSHYFGGLCGRCHICSTKGRSHTLILLIWLLFLCPHAHTARSSLCPCAALHSLFCWCRFYPHLPFSPCWFHGWEQHLWPPCALTAATLTCQALECGVFFFNSFAVMWVKRELPGRHPSCGSAHCSQLGSKVLLLLLLLLLTFHSFIGSTLRGAKSLLCAVLKFWSVFNVFKTLFRSSCALIVLLLCSACAPEQSGSAVN